ncbi:hypothetical protein H257_11963 [Aphanomyces astaci]|uniref:Uncharacterized protein n=1 Tax=Aphanomyces astaci TaxID=112090 RepID=W4G0D8_APHAT|nr:hypothetical protein H257_11963 [Aphanomyces astaci]ETV73145.1 hypothetical protein H257_11963 [Aphanomyces astaci]|eukprot:XP_009837350.1 hypothetical protein H257_11963 [Aphanomyces astaci]
MAAPLAFVGFFGVATALPPCNSWDTAKLLPKVWPCGVAVGRPFSKSLWDFVRTDVQALCTKGPCVTLFKTLNDLQCSVDPSGRVVNANIRCDTTAWLTPTTTPITSNNPPTPQPPTPQPPRTTVRPTVTTTLPPLAVPTTTTTTTCKPSSFPGGTCSNQVALNTSTANKFTTEGPVNATTLLRRQFPSNDKTNYTQNLIKEDMMASHSPPVPMLSGGFVIVALVAHLLAAMIW